MQLRRVLYVYNVYREQDPLDSQRIAQRVAKLACGHERDVTYDPPAKHIECRQCGDD